MCCKSPPTPKMKGDIIFDQCLESNNAEIQGNQSIIKDATRYLFLICMKKQ